VKVGFQIVLFIIILNLVSGLIYQEQVAGTQNANFLQSNDNGTSYQNQFNPSAMVNATTTSSSWISIPFASWVMQIAQAVITLWNAITVVVTGFPHVLSNIADMIPDTNGQSTFNAIATVIIGIESFLAFMWIFEVVTGRDTES
jgi:hypothetical protein